MAKKCSYIQMAKDDFACSDVDVPDQAGVRIGPGGEVWVEAWVRVETAAMRECGDAGDSGILAVGRG